MLRRKFDDRAVGDIVAVANGFVKVSKEKICSDRIEVFEVTFHQGCLGLCVNVITAETIVLFLIGLVEEHVLVFGKIVGADPVRADQGYLVTCMRKQAECVIMTHGKKIGAVSSCDRQIAVDVGGLFGRIRVRMVGIELMVFRNPGVIQNIVKIVRWGVVGIAQKSRRILTFGTVNGIQIIVAVSTVFLEQKAVACEKDGTARIGKKTVDRIVFCLKAVDTACLKVQDIVAVGRLTVIDSRIVQMRAEAVDI